MATWICPQWRSSVLLYNFAGHRRQGACSARAVTRRETSPVPHKLPGARNPCRLEGHGSGRQAIWGRTEAFSSQQQGETEQYGDGYEEEEEEEEDDEEETTVEAGGKVTPHACAEATCFEGIHDRISMAQLLFHCSLKCSSDFSIAVLNAHPIANKQSFVTLTPCG